MRPAGTRILRRVLLGVVVVVAVAVAWTLRRPASPVGPGSSAGGEAGEGTTIGDVSFFRFDAGEERLKIDAESWKSEEEGQTRLQGVKVTFPFVAQGEESTAVVTADECLYDAQRERALFRGNVHVVTGDGFEMTTESLDYLGDEGRVTSDEQVDFVRGGWSGRGRGLEYVMAEDNLVLESEVWMRFEGEERPPTEIESGRAFGSRKTRVVNFGQGVKLTQGSRRLTSDRLQLTLDEALESLERAAAIDEVDLLVEGGAEIEGTSLPSGGRRRLRCRRLNVEFHERGVLDKAVAVNHATLDLEPGPGESLEKRRLSGRAIRFNFDTEGRLARVTSWTGFPRYQEGPVVLTSEPADGSGPRRRVECMSDFTAVLDPETGEVKWTTFRRKVVFTEPGRRAFAENAHYEDPSGILRLSGGAPRVVDEGDGSELQAEQIDFRRSDQGISAKGGVRHEIRRRTAADGGGMLAGEEPTVLVCKEFEYDPALRKAWYRENALLRSGRDEVRAPLIVMEDPGPGQRRLHASGGVISQLHPRQSEPGDREAAPVKTRSAEMVYEERVHQVVYSGDVEIRQGDILTRSPEATVTLDETGNDVERIVAGEPVEVHQGVKQARGRTGTYTPRTETMVLEGDEVVLQDVDRRVEGRVLTFQVGEDRIRVDGREEVRTEAIFKRRGPSTP